MTSAHFWGQFRLAWLTYSPRLPSLRRLQREHLLPGLAGTSLFVLIGLGLWLNSELLWSLRTQDHAPPAMLPGDPLATAGTLAQRHLFGLPGATPERPEVTVEFSLLGILAGQRATSGAAILLPQGEKQPLIAHVGESIAPGIRLIGLSARQATLTRDGSPFTLDLPGPQQVAASALPPSTPHKPVFD